MFYLHKYLIFLYKYCGNDTLPERPWDNDDSLNAFLDRTKTKFRITEEDQICVPLQNLKIRNLLL